MKNLTTLRADYNEAHNEAMKSFIILENKLIRGERLTAEEDKMVDNYHFIVEELREMENVMNALGLEFNDVDVVKEMLQEEFEAEEAKAEAKAINTINPKLKEFNEKREERKYYANLKSNAQYDQDWEVYHMASERVEKLDKEFFNLCPTVNVSYYIGYRSYYGSVIKIGKAYFDHNGSTKMTKSRGYRSITEIEEITEKMHESMLSDSYYY